MVKKDVLIIGCGNPLLWDDGFGSAVIQTIENRFSRKTIHPVAAVPGGFMKPLSKEDCKLFCDHLTDLLAFVLSTVDYAKKEIFPKFETTYAGLVEITTGFIGMVDKNGALNLYEGDLLLMKPDGTFTDFPADQYLDHIAEKVMPFSYGKFPYAKSWNEGFSLDLDSPKGIYRSNTLARINVADYIPTPIAQKLLEEFRNKFGRPAQTLKPAWPQNPVPEEGWGALKLPEEL